MQEQVEHGNEESATEIGTLPPTQRIIARPQFTIRHIAAECI